jgi:hypothetical protein
VEFSSSQGFDAGDTVAIPTKPVTGASYALEPSDVARLAALAKRTAVTTLYYRVRGEDADGAFVTYSDAQTTAAP